MEQFTKDSKDGFKVMKKIIPDNINWKSPEILDYDTDWLIYTKKDFTSDFLTDVEQAKWEQTKYALPDSWRYFGTQPKNFYQVNKTGFRMSCELDDVDWKNTVAVFGCSHVFGKGVPVDSTVPYFFSEIHNTPTANLGVEGSSNDTIFNNVVHFLKNYTPKGIAILWSYSERINHIYKRDLKGGWAHIDMNASNWNDLQLLDNENKLVTVKNTQLYPPLQDQNLINNQHSLYLHNLYRNTAQLLAQSKNIEYWDCHFDNLLGSYRKQNCNALDSLDITYPEEHAGWFNYWGNWETKQCGWEHIPKKSQMWWLNNVVARDVELGKDQLGPSHFGPVVYKKFAERLVQRA